MIANYVFNWFDPISEGAGGSILFLCLQVRTRRMWPFWARDIERSCKKFTRTKCDGISWHTEQSEQGCSRVPFLRGTGRIKIPTSMNHMTVKSMRRVFWRQPPRAVLRLRAGVSNWEYQELGEFDFKCAKGINLI